MWDLMFVVLVAGAGVWAVAAVARVAEEGELALLPRHRRSRVEWCRVHHPQVAGVCGVLLAALVALQVVSSR